VCDCRDAVGCEATAGTAAVGTLAAGGTFHSAETTAESATVCRRRAREQDDGRQPRHPVCPTHHRASQG